MQNTSLLLVPTSTGVYTSCLTEKISTLPNYIQYGRDITQQLTDLSTNQEFKIFPPGEILSVLAILDIQILISVML